jgi:exopolyphosphatase / guanosine-5'-triphosphate,3'-diphosphate pyrophosphatase
MKKKVGIVDLGTNTFHLLIANVGENTYEIVYRDHLAVKLGKGGINNGVITNDAIRRGVEALTVFRQILDLHQVTQVIAIGTSALRNAANSAEVIAIFNEETGIAVDIISGDQEAALIFLGVHSALKLGHEKSLVMDIGGGSVEFIIGNETEIFWKHSFEIGGQRLLEQFQHHDPITTEEVEKLHQYLAEALKPLFIALNHWKPSTLVGSSGTFDTLSDIFCLRQGIVKGKDDAETPLSLDGFYEIYHELLTKNRQQRMQVAGMIELRVDMIVVACCLIAYLLSIYKFNSIRVSGYSLKEGVLHDLTSANHS